ncbi:MAG TPA: choice-of-anchor tandem repeat GloVer-containing protein, partial [Candidatus Acidoferrales bacterium]|nr:choice-of-anchor tandem repeat GloVer-containing protein [Candidatus Acidoferrales bacterium]
GGCGSVFELSLDGAYRTLVTFSGSNGQGPEAGLIALNGKLYGTTTSGGTGAGVVFEVLP